MFADEERERSALSVRRSASHQSVEGAGCRLWRRPPQGGEALTGERVEPVHAEPPGCSNGSQIATTRGTRARQGASASRSRWPAWRPSSRAPVGPAWNSRWGVGGSRRPWEPRSVSIRLGRLSSWPGGGAPCRSSRSGSNSHRSGHAPVAPAGLQVQRVGIGEQRRQALADPLARPPRYRSTSIVARFVRCLFSSQSR